MGEGCLMGTVLAIAVGILVAAAIGAYLDYRRICKRMNGGGR